MSLLLLGLSCHTWLSFVPCQAPSHDTSPCSLLTHHGATPYRSWPFSEKTHTSGSAHLSLSWPGVPFFWHFLFSLLSFKLKKNDTLSVGTAWLSCKHLYFPIPLLSLTRLLLVPCLFFIFYHNLLWWSSLFYFHCLSPFCTHHMERNLLYTISTISWCLKESIGKCAKSMTMNHFFSFWAYHAVCR